MYCTFFALQQHYTMLNSQILHKSVRHFYQTNDFKNINKSIFRVLLWNLHSNSAMEDYFSKFAKWETDNKAKIATWNKIKILQATKAVRLFCVSIGFYRFKTYAEHWQQQLPADPGKQAPNALSNTTQTLYKWGYHRLLILAFPTLSLYPSMLQILWLLSIMT